MYNYTKINLTENIICYKYNEKFNNQNTDLFKNVMIISSK